MAVTWTVTNLDSVSTSGSLSDVVTGCHWRAYDSETVGGNEYREELYGVVNLADPDASSFTAYDSITKDNAIAWAKAALGTDEVSKIEASITAKISELKSPTSKTETPSGWS